MSGTLVPDITFVGSLNPTFAPVSLVSQVQGLSTAIQNVSSSVGLIGANPSFSTITVAEPSLINGVGITNGVINTAAAVQCLLLQTLNVEATAGMETDNLLTSSITNQLSINTSSITTNHVNSQTLTVNQGGSYIPYLSTNLLTQGAGWPSDSDTNVPLLSTLGISTMGFFMKSPSVNGDYKQITTAPIAPLNLSAQYYKSVLQTMTSGNTDVTFDLTQPWNQTGGCITHTNGTTDFTVAKAGIYQLEFHATVISNGASWTTTTNKAVAINITRSPTAQQTILINTAFIASATNYGQIATGTIELQVGDVIVCRVGNTFTGGPAYIQPVQNTFDYNTTFTWRLITPL